MRAVKGMSLCSAGHSKEVLLADPLWEVPEAEPYMEKLCLVLQELKYMHLEAARELVEVKAAWRRITCCYLLAQPLLLKAGG